MMFLRLALFHLLSLQSVADLFCPADVAVDSHTLTSNTGSFCIIYAHNEQLLAYSIS